MMRNSFFAMLQRRRFVVIVTLAIALIALPFLLIKIKPSYVGVAHVIMVGKTDTSMIPNTDMGTLTMSTTVLERIQKRFKLTSTLDNFRAHIDAKPALRSNVMPISYRDPDPKLARSVTNALADETVAFYKQLSSDQFDIMVSYLRTALQKDSNQMQAIDGELQRAAQRDTFVGSGQALDTITTRIGTLETQRGVAYATLVSDEAIAGAQSAQPKEIAGIVKQEVLAGDPYVQALRAGQSKDAAQLEFQRAQFTDLYPGLPSLRDQVERETSVVTAAERTAVSGSSSSSSAYAATVLAKRNALAIAAGDRARVAAIDAQIATEQQHLRDLPGTGARVNLLRAQRDGAQAAYGASVLRLNDALANQAAASSIGSIVVVDRAVTAQPRIPRVALDIIIALLLLALTVSVAFAVDVLDPGLRSPEAIEKLYGIPVIGNIGPQ